MHCVCSAFYLQRKIFSPEFCFNLFHSPYVTFHNIITEFLTSLAIHWYGLFFYFAIHFFFAVLSCFCTHSTYFIYLLRIYHVYPTPYYILSTVSIPSKFKAFFITLVVASTIARRAFLVSISTSSFIIGFVL